MDPMPPLRTLRLPVAGVASIYFLSFVPLPQRVRRLPFREPGTPGLSYQAFAQSALSARRSEPLLPSLGVVVCARAFMPVRSVKLAV